MDILASPGPSPAASAVKGLLDRAFLDPARRIFVNRTIRMESIRQIGFDMDYTLLPYKKRTIEALAFRLTTERLVERNACPKEALSIVYDPNFVVRGLVVDKRLGNIFKMDGHHQVGRVYHGRRALSKEERHALYRNQKIRLTALKYHWIDTLFSLPEGVLYADLIDLLEINLRQKDIDYWSLFDQIRTTIDECHRDGSLKSIIKAAPEEYIEFDTELPHTLHKLRSAGKRLFVLTNSHWDYTNSVMSFILDGKLSDYPSWLNYFDFVIVGADKPAFFHERREFFEVDRKTGIVATTPATRLERQHVYQGGCLERFDEIVGVAGEQTLYVGDHIYGDIIRSKRHTLWRTALILTELEDELRLLPRLQPLQSDLVDLEARQAILEDEMTELRLKLAALETAIDDVPDRDHVETEELSRIRRQLRSAFDEKRRDMKDIIQRRDALGAEIDRMFNPCWGSVFKEGAENSRFGRQVESYACLYTSRVSNFLAYSPQQYFRAPRHWMPHEKT